MDNKNNNQLSNKDWKKGFLTIISGQTISIIGSSAVQFSLIWWLATETSSPLMMSFAGLFAFLPQLILGPFAGVWVDRLKRKTIIICADLFIGLVAAFFAISFIIWNPPFWMACMVLGIRAVGSVFHTPAIQAVVPMLVPREELIRANGWNQFMQSGAYMLGPVVGAAMYASLPLPIILISDLVGAIVASVSTAIVKIPEIEHEKQIRPNYLGEIKEGFQVYVSDKRLFNVTITMMVSMIFFMPLASLYPLMISDYFKATAWHASINQISYAVGMMIGAAIISSIGVIKNKLGIVRIGIVALGVTSILSGILPHNLTGFWFFTAVCLVMGAVGNAYSIPYAAYLQETIPKEAHGRAFSLMGSLMSVAMPIGLLIAGPTAERYGVPVWFVIAGIAIIIITGISIALSVSINVST
ncbi:major facilitator superfamily MFS_1 [Desulfofarcimen acetoxidans DSM 771]|uniref:Major facilitator superfamily MFS_1 n=1 Tax=Desulfofarcimen acetoxidans (strain ATCC 49208 / DSM 771 / KCTC 5769 / VKM B-1644 / 5575) TaxID=485916 RepID=C8VVR6_DESAS|nr:MFS transporter [Desulfofarcimen acetoxidans]ACV62381.1 major facilitator superfamily MFS_1 [Desulfofarcimen acetoxidans DSM 771]